MHRNTAIITDAFPLTVVALTLLYSTIGTSPLIISPMRTTYAGTLVESTDEVILNLSNNGGNSFSSVTRALRSNNIYVTWVDDTPAYKEVSQAKSIDGGTSFRNATILSNNNTLPEELQIAASDSNLYATGNQSQLTDTTIGAAPTAMQQLKQYLQEAYVAAEDNDMLGVLGALDNASRALLLIERRTLGPANNNTTDHIGITTTDRSSGQADNADSLLTYENSKKGIRIKYPSDWQVREDPKLVAIFTSATKSPYDTPETLNIAVEDLPSKTLSLNRYTNAGISKLRFLQDFNMTESEDTTLAGFPAHKIIYTFTMFEEPEGNYPLKNMQIWTVKDGKAYIVTYGGVLNQFSESLADAQTMVDSFEIVNIGSPQPTISAQGRIG